MSKVEFRCLTISTGDGRRYLDQEMGRYRRKYLVSVRSDATNLTRRFTFHASVADEERGKVGLNSDELLYAFYCFVSDAIVGEQTFADFCDDYGYDMDSLSAHRTWMACKQSARKVRALFSGQPDLCEMANELQAMTDA